MRIVFTLFVCLCLSVAISQQGTIKVQKQEDFLPRITGKAGGDISRYYLCDSKGITIGYDSKIVSFVLYFIDEHGQEYEVKIEGNKVPDEHCKKIMGLPNLNIVYFQEIMVENKGRTVKVTPMMFTLKDEN